MDEVSQAVGFAQSRAWIPLASLLINVLVRLSKNDAAVAWFPVHLRPRARAGAAIVLGIASGVVAGLAGGAGGSWASALAGGVVAGALAIATHEVVIEGARKGRDVGSRRPPPMPPLVVLAIASIVLPGCSGRPPVPHAIEAAYHADLVESYGSARSCLDARAALRRVEERWAPAWKGFARAPSAPPTLECAGSSP